MKGHAIYHTIGGKHIIEYPGLKFIKSSNWSKYYLKLTISF